MFHVKQWLLADAKISKDDIQQLLDIDPPGDASDRAHSQPQVFGEQLSLALCQLPFESADCFFQGLPMACAGNNGRLGSAICPGGDQP